MIYYMCMQCMFNKKYKESAKMFSVVQTRIYFNQRCICLDHEVWRNYGFKVYDFIDIFTKDIIRVYKIVLLCPVLEFCERRISKLNILANKSLCILLMMSFYLISFLSGRCNFLYFPLRDL